MLVRQIGDFSRFLEVISFSQASQLNLASLAREAEIPHKWAKRQLVQHHKFFYFDVGVYRSLRPRGPLDSAQEIEGLALETLVAQHLRGFC